MLFRSVYSATVHGYRTRDGELWNINRVVKVEDEFAGLDARLLINSVQFQLTEDTGRTTVLGLIDRNAYEMTLAEPIVDKMGLGLVDYNVPTQWDKLPQ